MLIIYALVAACLFGCSDFLGGFSILQQSARATILVSQATWLAFAILLSLFVPGRLTSHEAVLGIAIGLASLSGAYLLYRSFATGAMSTAAPVFGLSNVATPVLLGLLLGARLTPRQTIGLMIVVIAIIMLRGGNEWRKLKPHDWLSQQSLMPLGAGAAFGIAAPVLMSRSDHTSGLWLFVIVSLTTVLIVAGSGLIRPIQFARSRRTLTLATAAGLIQLLAGIASLLSVRTGNVPIVGAIIALAPAVTAILAIVILHERPPGIKLLGLGAAFVAILTLTI